MDFYESELITLIEDIASRMQRIRVAQQKLVAKKKRGFLDRRKRFGGSEGKDGVWTMGKVPAGLEP